MPMLDAYIPEGALSLSAERKSLAPYKMRIHRQCLSEWRERAGTGANYSLEELWRIREECIAALERKSARAVVPENVS